MLNRITVEEYRRRHSVFWDSVWREAVKPNCFKCLDIATGSGSSAGKLYEITHGAITSIDVCENALANAREKIPVEVALVQCDASKLPFRSASMELIVIHFTFHEIPPEKRELLLMECRRVLKRKGRICVIDGHVHDRHSLRYWLTDIVTRMALESGKYHENYPEASAIARELTVAGFKVEIERALVNDTPVPDEIIEWYVKELREKFPNASEKLLKELNRFKETALKEGLESLGATLVVGVKR